MTRQNSTYLPVSWLVRQRLGLPGDRVRNEGIHLLAGRGGGKSRFLGRYLAPLDFVRGVPTVIFDNGDTIDNFLDKLASMDTRLQDLLWPHVRYVNMAGQNGRIVPFPILYRIGEEADQEIAERFVDAIRRLHPELEGAQVQGFPPLARAARAAGRILLAIGGTITDMPALLTKPAQFAARITQALAIDPMLQSAVDDLAGVKNTDTLLNNLSMFRADPTIAAIYGAKTPGINWYEVFASKQIVLLDFRDIRSTELRRFSLVWAFWYLIDFLRYRGGTLTEPISVIVDEFSALTNVQSPEGQRVFGQDLDFLLNTVMRRHSIWLTLAHQEMGQFDRKVQQMLLGMGTQILGVVPDMDEAVYLARQFFRIDPYKIKRTETQYFRSMGRFGEFIELPVGETIVEFTIPEQHYEAAYTLRQVPSLHFLAKHPREVEAQEVSIAELEKGVYPRKSITEAIRSMLTERDAQPISQVLSEIVGASTKATTLSQRDTIRSNADDLRTAQTAPEADNDEDILSEKG